MRSQFGVIFYLCIFALFSIAAARVSDEKEAASDKELKEGERKQKCMYFHSKDFMAGALKSKFWDGGI